MPQHKSPKKCYARRIAAAYPDLHEHLEAAQAGLLLEVDRPIDKDAELHPLVRWQFVGGIEEHERKAFLFTNVVDGPGRQVRDPGRGRRDRGEPRDLQRRHGRAARGDRREVDQRHRQSDRARASSTTRRARRS